MSASDTGVSGSWDQVSEALPSESEGTEVVDLAVLAERFWRAVATGDAEELANVQALRDSVSVEAVVAFSAAGRHVERPSIGTSAITRFWQARRISCCLGLQLWRRPVG